MTIVQASNPTKSLTPHLDQCFIDPKGPRLSLEYAKGRAALNEDFKFLFAMNEPLAKRKRKELRHALVELLGGKVSLNEKKKHIVTFPDNTVARL
jgi:hypothetical protein